MKLSNELCCLLQSSYEIYVGWLILLCNDTYESCFMQQAYDILCQLFHLIV